MSARTDLGVRLLRAAKKLKSPCEFQTRRARMIKGIILDIDENTMKLYIQEGMVKGSVNITEILRGDISHITYGPGVMEEAGFGIIEPDKRTAQRLADAYQAGQRGEPYVGTTDYEREAYENGKKNPIKSGEKK